MAMNDPTGGGQYTHQQQLREQQARQQADNQRAADFARARQESWNQQQDTQQRQRQEADRQSAANSARYNQEQQARHHEWRANRSGSNSSSASSGSSGIDLTGLGKLVAPVLWGTFLAAAGFGVGKAIEKYRGAPITPSSNVNLDAHTVPRIEPNSWPARPRSSANDSAPLPNGYSGVADLIGDSWKQQANNNEQPVLTNTERTTASKEDLMTQSLAQLIRRATWVREQLGGDEYSIKDVKNTNDWKARVVKNLDLLGSLAGEQSYLRAEWTEPKSAGVVIYEPLFSSKSNLALKTRDVRNATPSCQLDSSLAEEIAKSDLFIAARDAGGVVAGMLQDNLNRAYEFVERIPNSADPKKREARGKVTRGLVLCRDLTGKRMRVSQNTLLALKGEIGRL